MLSLYVNDATAGSSGSAAAVVSRFMPSAASKSISEQSASASASPVGRLPAQLVVASIDRKLVDPPVALAHGCALAAAGSSATAIAAIAKLTRPTIPFFGATRRPSPSFVRCPAPDIGSDMRGIPGAREAGRGFFSTVVDPLELR